MTDSLGSWSILSGALASDPSAGCQVAVIPDDPSDDCLAEFELGAEMDGGAAESQRRGVEESDRRKSELVELDGRGRARRRPAAEGVTLRPSERESVGKSEDEQDMATGEC